MTGIFDELDSKTIDISEWASRASDKENILTQLLEGLTFKKEQIRSNCSKVVEFISVNDPELLYPKWWEYFVALLGSENTYHKLSSLVVIANLTRVDAGNKFETIFEKYFDLINDKSMVTAAWIAGNAGKIFKAKPDMGEKIAWRLLDIDNTHHDPERKDLIKAYAIESLDIYYEKSENKAQIIAFVKDQLNCKSNKTRKIAKAFMKKHAIETS